MAAGTSVPGPFPPWSCGRCRQKKRETASSLDDDPSGRYEVTGANKRNRGEEILPLPTPASSPHVVPQLQDETPFNSVYAGQTNVSLPPLVSNAMMSVLSSSIGSG
jgi:hypothetical protein